MNAQREPLTGTKTHGFGVVQGNPTRCLACGALITEFDLWAKYTSPVDPQFGAYSIIVHQRCDDGSNNLKPACVVAHA